MMLGQIDRGIAEGSIPSDIDKRDATDMMLIFVEGIGLLAPFHPARFSVRRQNELLDRLFERLNITASPTSAD